MKFLLPLLTALLLSTSSAYAVCDIYAADSVVTDSIKKSTKAKNDTTGRKSSKSEYAKLMEKEVSHTDGLFTVRHIEEKYYFEVPDTLLGRLLLAVTRFTGVPQGFSKFAGEEITHCAVYFEQRDKTLLLRQYVLSTFADKDDNISRTLERATIDPIVQSFKVIGSNPTTKAQLIEVTQLFNQDNHLTSLPSASKTQLKLGGLAGNRTYIDTIKVFPTNIEIATTRTYSTSSGTYAASQTGSATVGFNTSIVLLPREPMRRRLWDSRVGYFTNTLRHFSDNQRKARHEQFISRYRLVPRDKKAYRAGRLSEPEKPIVYYIDPATPAKWIPYLKQGIEDWNKAFEAAGFKNAIIARDWPKNRPDMSLDDARFSVLRYLPSETENAYGPRIVDPRSGEIIEAHICWYHNVQNLLTKWYMVQCGPLDKRAQQMDFPDALMGQLIRFVSSHEVGHTLGLRHNMGASWATPVEKLRDKQWVEANGHTVSIMDYARFNYVAQPEDRIGERGLFPRIGEYDLWAIKWGYQWRPEFDDEFEEKEALMTETTAALRQNPRLWFGGEGRGDDPRSQSEDLGDNSVKASRYGLKNLKRVVAALPQWTAQADGQTEDLQTMYKAATDQYTRYIGHVLRNIGGKYQNNLPNLPAQQNVPADRQREALQFMAEEVFRLPRWLYPDTIVERLAIDVLSDQTSRQETHITRMLAPTLLANLSDQSATDAKAYSIEAYLEGLAKAVFSTTDASDRTAAAARRNLQRTYVQHLHKLLIPATDKSTSPTDGRIRKSDAAIWLTAHLDTVEQHCNSLKEKAQSTIDRLHYADLLQQIDNIRKKLKGE